MRKNEAIQLEIDALNSEGTGVGRHEGLVVFVAGALPGEIVEAKIIKLKKNYAIARLEQILSVSNQRVEPPCPHYSKCGGCSLQHLSYAAQLEHKQQRIVDSLQRIGGMENISMLPIEASPQQFGYRNKAALPISPGKDGLAIGPFARKSHRVIDVERCIIQHEYTTPTIAAVKEYARQNNISAYDESTGSGVLRHILLRVSSTGNSVLTLVCKKAPEMAGLIALSEKLPIDGLVLNINDKDTNVILGDEFQTIYGNSDIMENICGIDLRVSPASFLQVNYSQCEQLYSYALELADIKSTDTVVDAYCGIGSMSLLFAKHAAKVYGIECVDSAVDNAVYNAAANQLDAEFALGYAEDTLPKMMAGGIRPDVLLLDPPRKGCEQRLLQCAIEMAAKRIVYVSCNPSTLARDAAILTSGGYELVSVKGFDMFPQTSHVECAALFVLSLPLS